MPILVLKCMHREVLYMLPAIIEIHQVLVRSSYSEEEADALVARLMEEEAFDFVRCIENVSLDDINKINDMN